MERQRLGSSEQLTQAQRQAWELGLRRKHVTVLDKASGVSNSRQCRHKAARDSGARQRPHGPTLFSVHQGSGTVTSLPKGALKTAQGQGTNECPQALSMHYRHTSLARAPGLELSRLCGRLVGGGGGGRGSTAGNQRFNSNVPPVAMGLSQVP